MVRTSGRGAWTPLELPLTIGSDLASDIVVNAQTMRSVSKVIAPHAGTLALVDLATQRIDAVSELRVFGIDVVGPFSENPREISKIKFNWRRFLAWEANYYLAGASGFLRRFLPPRQSRRLGLALILALGLLAFFVFAPEPEDKAPDLSGVPLPAEHGSVANLAVQSSGINAAYAKGASVRFSPAPSGQAGQYLLTLTLSGLDLADELRIVFNGKDLGATSPMLGCIDEFCSLDFRIEPELLKPGGNMLNLVHQKPASAYALKNVFFRTMEPATAEELERIKQLLLAAERFHDERFLLVQNIRSAQDAIDEAGRLMTTRTGTDDLKPRFQLTKEKVTKAFQDISADLQFKIQKELKLNHQKQALGLINDLLRLYPGPGSKQNSFLSEHKRRLEKALQK